MVDLLELVKNKIKFVPKERLVECAIQKGLISNKKVTAGDAAAVLLNDLDVAGAAELVKEFGDIIGLTSTELQDKLQITKQERLKWTKKNLLNVTGYYRVREYGRYLDCPIYDALQVITDDDIKSWRSTEKPLTEKQKEGIRKSQVTALKNRTCIECASVQSYKDKLSGGLCRYCNNKKIAMKRRSYWLEHKEKYCIVDTETTGLTSWDQVIEISIIDLDGNILLNTLCMPTIPISEEAMQVHNIDIKTLVDANAPSWKTVYPKVKRILDDRIMIAYNAEFDERMILQTCRDNNIAAGRINYECLMHNAMTYYSSERYIKLQDVTKSCQEHRSLGDCMMCLEIINQV